MNKERVKRHERVEKQEKNKERLSYILKDQKEKTHCFLDCTKWTFYDLAMMRGAKPSTYNKWNWTGFDRFSHKKTKKKSFSVPDSSSRSNFLHQSAGSVFSRQRKQEVETNFLKLDKVLLLRRWELCTHALFMQWCSPCSIMWKQRLNLDKLMDCESTWNKSKLICGRA